MGTLIEFIKVFLIGIVEGITEWLPISSTGHMILLEEFWPLAQSEEFIKMFNVVIQLGAILAVVTVFFDKLNPFTKKKTEKEKKATYVLWEKVIVSCIPAGVLGILLDDWLDEHFYNAYVVAAMLILYGIFFILVENYSKDRDFRVKSLSRLDFRTALLIGGFQVLALIPGTSRSGATILGALFLGCSRSVAAEFTFYLAIPVMAGASGLKVLKYLLKDKQTFAGAELGILLFGMVVAYLVSVLVIRFLMGYIRKKDFKPFAFYRIILGLIVLIVFMLR